MARSGEIILDSLFNNATIRELVPSRLPKTRIGLLFAILAAEIEGWEMVLDNYAKEAYLADATFIDNIKKLAEPMYMATSARPSEVYLKFGWEEEADDADKVDSVIEFGTIIQSTEMDPVQFMVIEKTILYRTASVAFARGRSIEKGADTMVGAGALNSISGGPMSVTVTNPQASWGGCDDEFIESVRSNAMSARYSMIKGTKDHLDLVMAKMGLSKPQYNFFEGAYGPGTFALYVDTDSEDQLAEIDRNIREAKAEGIYFTTDHALPIYIDLTFTTMSVLNGKQTPELKANLRLDLLNGVKAFIYNNGVGQTIVISHLIHYLYEQFLEKYDFYDLNIDTSDLNPNLLDSEGNIFIQPKYVVKINNINIIILTG